MKPRHNRHDLFFKLAFGDPALANELLTLALAERDSDLLPLGPLRISKDTFVKPELADLYSDLLFEAPSSASPLLIYILFEHKSSPDRYAVFQLYRYMGEVWALWVEKKASILPRIIPIIVYHGRTRWRKPLSVREYFVPSPEYAGIGPELRPLFLDLARIPAERFLRLSAETRAALGALRAAFSRDPKDREPALDFIRTAKVITDLIIGLIRYLYDTSPREAEGDILRSVTLPRNRELYMTIAEKYRNEGILKGRRDDLVRLLTKKFALSGDERLLVTQCDDLNRLATALDEILEADSKEQVLAKLRHE